MGFHFGCLEIRVHFDCIAVWYNSLWFLFLSETLSVLRLPCSKPKTKGGLIWFIFLSEQEHGTTNISIHKIK
jgi:hypothetical protein